MSRARRNLEALVAALLERGAIGTAALGHLVESIARREQIGPSIDHSCWYHAGLRSFVNDLVSRLAPELGHEPPGLVDESAAAHLAGVEWSDVPREVASELAYRLAYRCRVQPGPCFCGYHRGTTVASESKNEPIL